jgi:hypothetical protein
LGGARLLVLVARATRSHRHSSRAPTHDLVAMRLGDLPSPSIWSYRVAWAERMRRRMSTLPPIPARGQPIGTADADIAHAIALLSEGLLTRAEFHALTGIDAQQIPQHLADATRLVNVQRTALQLRNSGTLARLEALHHARDAVGVAAQIMRNSETHASNRLAAAAFIAKVSGTQRPVDDPAATAERFTVTINIGGGRPPIVIETPASQSVSNEVSEPSE